MSVIIWVEFSNEITAVRSSSPSKVQSAQKSVKPPLRAKMYKSQCLGPAVMSKMTKTPQYCSFCKNIYFLNKFLINFRPFIFVFR